MDRKELYVVKSKVVINLPTWIDDEKYERRNIFYYGKGHAYCGSINRQTYTNMIQEALFHIPNVSVQEIYVHCMNCWVEVKVTEGLNIEDVMDKIQAVLEQFEDDDYVSEITQDYNINKPD